MKRTMLILITIALCSVASAASRNVAVLIGNADYAPASTLI